MSATSFIVEARNGFTAERLSGKWEMAEVTSSTLIGVKNTKHSQGVGEKTELWNWNRIISAAEEVLKLSQNYFSNS